MCRRPAGSSQSSQLSPAVTQVAAPKSLPAVAGLPVRGCARLARPQTVIRDYDTIRGGARQSSRLRHAVAEGRASLNMTTSVRCNRLRPAFTSAVQWSVAGRDHALLFSARACITGSRIHKSGSPRPARHAVPLVRFSAKAADLPRSGEMMRWPKKRHAIRSITCRTYNCAAPLNRCTDTSWPISKRIKSSPTSSRPS